MTAKVLVKKLKALKTFAKMSAANLITFLYAIIASMTANPAFLTPPVTITSLKDETDKLVTLAAAAADGGTKAIGEKNKQQSLVIKMLEQIAHYVEANSNDDLVTFQSSGFTPAPTSRPPVQQPSVPAFKNVNQGNTGEMVIQMQPSTPRPLTSECHYAPVVAGGGTPAVWTTVPLTGTRVTIKGLTPGTAYIFQVRAVGKLGYTDWSDAVTRISL